MIEFKNTIKKAAALVGMCLLLGVISSQAANLTVNTTADAGIGSLRQAILDATTNAAANTITFAIPTSDPGFNSAANRFSIVLVTSLPDLPLAPITIDNQQPQFITVSGNNSFRIFKLVDSAVVIINNLTISGGKSSDGLGGGAFYMGASSTLTLNGITLNNNNSTSNGGAIYMNNSGTLNITNSTISGNTSQVNGGGIYVNFSGTLNLRSSTISGNAATGSGGGIFNNTSGTINATNNTINGNSASGDGGGIYNAATLTSNNNTVTSNSANAGGGIYNNFTGTLNSSIVALNTATSGDGNDILGRGDRGTAFTGTYNLIGNADGSAGLAPASNQLGSTISPINPQIGPLANNGGPTLTRALLSGSRAIDKGNSPGLIVDQRGLPRPVDNLSITNTGDGSDVGSYEVQATEAIRLVISEISLRGTSGVNDEFVEIYNNSNSSITVNAPDGSAGYALAASDGVARFTIPNGTVIPARGHYLGVGSSYSLTAAASGDASFSTNIPTNAGVALFNTANSANFTLANRIDAAGSTSEANTLYREGAGYPAINDSFGDSTYNYTFYRDNCGKQGSISNFAPCTTTMPIDTNNNATDFVFADPNGMSLGAGQRLGAKGPENLSSPINRTESIPASLIAQCVSPSVAPNRVRDTTPGSSLTSSLGTLDYRRRFTNNTGAPITQLRFRITDITTSPAPSGVADLRPISSTDIVISNPCAGGAAVTVRGTTLDQPPIQSNGGGFNSTLSAGTVTLANPLGAGATVDLHFLLGVQQGGSVKFFIVIEALP